MAWELIPERNSRRGLAVWWTDDHRKAVAIPFAELEDLLDEHHPTGPPELDVDDEEVEGD